MSVSQEFLDLMQAGSALQRTKDQVRSKLSESQAKFTKDFAAITEGAIRLTAKAILTHEEYRMLVTVVFAPGQKPRDRQLTGDKRKYTLLEISYHEYRFVIAYGALEEWYELDAQALQEIKLMVTTRDRIQTEVQQWLKEKQLGDLIIKSVVIRKNPTKLTEEQAIVLVCHPNKEWGKVLISEIGTHVGLPVLLTKHFPAYQVGGTSAEKALEGLSTAWQQGIGETGREPHFDYRISPHVQVVYPDNETHYLGAADAECEEICPGIWVARWSRDRMKPEFHLMTGHNKLKAQVQIEEAVETSPKINIDQFNIKWHRLGGIYLLTKDDFPKDSQLFEIFRPMLEQAGENGHLMVRLIYNNQDQWGYKSSKPIPRQLAMSIVSPKVKGFSGEVGLGHLHRSSWYDISEVMVRQDTQVFVDLCELLQQISDKHEVVVPITSNETVLGPGSYSFSMTILRHVMALPQRYKQIWPMGTNDVNPEIKQHVHFMYTMRDLGLGKRGKGWLAMSGEILPNHISHQVALLVTDQPITQELIDHLYPKYKGVVPVDRFEDRIDISSLNRIELVPWNFHAWGLLFDGITTILSDERLQIGDFVITEDKWEDLMEYPIGTHSGTGKVLTFEEVFGNSSASKARIFLLQEDGTLISMFDWLQKQTVAHLDADENTD